MQATVNHLEDTFDHIRAGRATVKLLDGIKCECYGTMMEVTQCANCSCPDAKSIVIQPWDKGMLRVIEKAVIDSPLGITPENNETEIHLPIGSCIPRIIAPVTAKHVHIPSTLPHLFLLFSAFLIANMPGTILPGTAAIAHTIICSKLLPNFKFFSYIIYAECIYLSKARSYFIKYA